MLDGAVRITSELLGGLDTTVVWPTSDPGPRDESRPVGADPPCGCYRL